MIENIFILKSPTAELPADYSGGFIKISTTGIPSGNGFSVSYGTALRQYATFGDFLSEKGSKTDWLTAGVKHRDLPDAMPAHLDTYESATNPASGKGLHNWAQPEQFMGGMLHQQPFRIRSFHWG
jgi:hypothetical protein